jgi:hypothetical protein
LDEDAQVEFEEVVTEEGRRIVKLIMPSYMTLDIIKSKVAK